MISILTITAVLTLLKPFTPLGQALYSYTTDRTVGMREQDASKQRERGPLTAERGPTPTAVYPPGIDSAHARLLIKTVQSREVLFLASFELP